jgi:hypothetical protein
MKKLVFGATLAAAFVIGSFASVPAHGINPSAGANGNGSSVAPARSGGERLDQKVSPEVLMIDDWLCDGMTPCVRLSGAR